MHFTKQTVAAAAVFLTSLSTGFAATLDFDDVVVTDTETVVHNGYHDFTWDNFAFIPYGYHAGSGYDVGTISGANTIFNMWGEPAGFASATPFTLNSLWLTSAWEAVGSVTISAFGNGVELFSKVVGITDVAPKFVALNWTGVDSVLFSSEDQHFVLDDLTVNVDVAVVPLPAAAPLLLLGLGALGIAARRRRKTTA